MPPYRANAYNIATASAMPNKRRQRSRKQSLYKQQYIQYYYSTNILYTKCCLAANTYTGTASAMPTRDAIDSTGWCIVMATIKTTYAEKRYCVWRWQELS